MPDRKIAATLAKAHLESVFTDYIVFAFNSGDEPFKLEEFGNVSSPEILAKMKELLLAKSL